MGIRKHFEEMKGEGDLKLRDLNLEDEKRERELDFDPERDISEERINRMKEMVLQGAEAEDDHDFWEYGESAAYFKILFPNRFDRDVFEKAWYDKMLEKLKNDSMRKKGDLYNFIHNGVYFALLFPDRIGELNINNEVFDRRMEQVRILMNQNMSNLAVDSLFKMAILFPGRLKKCRTVVEAHWNGIKKKLTEELDEGELVGSVASLRILTSRRIEVPKREWEYQKEFVDDGFSKDGGSEPLAVFGLAAVTLVMLLAEEVKLTSEGLELVMGKEDFKREKKKRPIRRNF